MKKPAFESLLFIFQRNNERIIVLRTEVNTETRKKIHPPDDALALTPLENHHKSRTLLKIMDFSVIAVRFPPYALSPPALDDFIIKHARIYLSK